LRPSSPHRPAPSTARAASPAQLRRRHWRLSGTTSGIAVSRVFHYAPATHWDNAQLKCGDGTVITQRLVALFKIKHTADGQVTRATARATYADTGEESRFGGGLSANPAGHTFRYTCALANELRGVTIETSDIN
jgi:hypothetical protein